MDWILYGSGPSAGRWRRPFGVLVATVNGGESIVERPDAYGVFELQAGKAYARAISRMLRRGSTVYMRPRAITRAGQSANCNIIRHVDENFGPHQLRDLHQDIQWAAEHPEVPEFGQHIAWISSGVLMLWVLAEAEKAKRIFIAGLDGYPLDTVSADYAQGISKVHDLDTEPSWMERRRQLNRRMLEGIERISWHYKDVEFIFLEQPNHNLVNARVRVATPDDLQRLYAQEVTHGS